MFKRLSITILSAFLCICLITTQLHAEDLNIQKNPEIVETISNEDGSTTYRYSDDILVTEKDGVYNVTIPEYAIDYEPPVMTRSVIGTIWAVISTTMTACTIFEWTFGPNPCEIAYKYLLRLLGTGATTGKYVVNGTYHPGYIPGCEPRHSSPCNSGYYEYSFVRE